MCWERGANSWLWILGTTNTWRRQEPPCECDVGSLRVKICKERLILIVCWAEAGWLVDAHGGCPNLIHPLGSLEQLKVLAFRKVVDKLERVQKEVMKMIKGLKSLLYEEGLKDLCVFTPGEGSCWTSSQYSSTQWVSTKRAEDLSLQGGTWRRELAMGTGCPGRGFFLIWEIIYLCF